ncbi:DUF2752 domain-containing protein [uncultured Cyclobacterium sp.]|uniref:DUF2752 domain-containing protein n=1 Tax=uncultured Cyclobacterium sp. TaxID=453820 RepID=UPI0030EF636A
MKVINSGILELILWTIALLGLYTAGADTSHSFSLCPLDLLGFTWCPGCGIGRSIHYLMHGDFTTSWAYHPLGGFAFLVIILRIIELIKLNLNKKLWQMY